MVLSTGVAIEFRQSSPSAPPTKIAGGRRSMTTVEQDRMIFEDNQRFMAERMQARVRSHAVDHAPVVTAPAVVLDVLREAISVVQAKNAA